MSYYSEKLSGNRLKQCYAIAPARIVQYLDAEIDYILSIIQPTDSVLELGCGYGRITKKIAEIANNVTGIDTANDSLQLAKANEGLESKITYLKMDATQMEFRDMTFDVVFCVQNGICAFGVDKSILIQEALRVTQPGGKVIFSSYSNNIWADRLRWFELQSAHGLLGEIDYQRTGQGTIACKDGFYASSLTTGEFQALCTEQGITPELTEIDNSSIMCLIIRPQPV